MSYRTSYEDNHVSFEIGDIIWEDDYAREVGGEDPPEIDQERLDQLEGTGLQETIREKQEREIESFEKEVHNISFEYEAPAISVDTAGRFVKHEIIGGATVRQKIGEDPIQVTIDGVCKESTAKRLDNLRDAKHGTIYSNRLPKGGSLKVHFASTSTAPLEDSGAVAISDDAGEFLYNYTLSTVEVVV